MADLAIDLGTCNTVAVVRRPGGPPRALLFDGSPVLPSAVFADPAGTIHVGRDAERLMPGDASRFEPFPKRRVDEGRVLLGDREVEVAELFAAILRRVRTEAGRAAAGPVVLTVPADWGAPRRAVLQEAARRAGLGPVTLIDEPIAAATYCVGVLAGRVPPGGHLAVFDFGGGTLDVTVVRQEAAGLRVLATGGLDDLGGVDIDAALVGHLGQLLSMTDPAAWRRISTPRTPGDLRDRRAFWSEIRAAKEMLSRASSAPVHVPGRDQALHLNREEVERVAGPLVDRAVDETRRVLTRVGLPPGALSAMLLVGGSSRLPLAASRLQARCGIAPVVPEQPELPVALGALTHADSLTGPQPASVPAVPGVPGSGPPPGPARPGPTAPDGPLPPGNAAGAWDPPGPPVTAYGTPPGRVRPVDGPVAPSGGGVYIGPGVRLSGAVTVVGEGGTAPAWASTVDEDVDDDEPAVPERRRRGGRTGRAAGWVAGRLWTLFLVALPLTIVVITVPQAREVFDKVWLTVTGGP